MPNIKEMIPNPPTIRNTNNWSLIMYSLLKRILVKLFSGLTPKFSSAGLGRSLSRTLIWVRKSTWLFFKSRRRLQRLVRGNLMGVTRPLADLPSGASHSVGALSPAYQPVFRRTFVFFCHSLSAFAPFFDHRRTSPFPRPGPFSSFHRHTPCRVG